MTIQRLVIELIEDIINNQLREDTVREIDNFVLSNGTKELRFTIEDCIKIMSEAKYLTIEKDSSLAKFIGHGLINGIFESELNESSLETDYSFIANNINVISNYLEVDKYKLEPWLLNHTGSMEYIYNSALKAIELIDSAEDSLEYVSSLLTMLDNSMSPITNEYKLSSLLILKTILNYSKTNYFNKELKHACEHLIISLEETHVPIKNNSVLIVGEPLPLGISKDSKMGLEVFKNLTNELIERFPDHNLLVQSKDMYTSSLLSKSPFLYAPDFDLEPMLENDLLEALVIIGPIDINYSNTLKIELLNKQSNTINLTANLPPSMNCQDFNNYDKINQWLRIETKDSDKDFPKSQNKTPLDTYDISISSPLNLIKSMSKTNIFY